MRQNVNQEQIEGRIYQHDLKEKVTGDRSKHPGTKFISGTMDIATTEDDMNVLTVHYTYVTEMTSKGKPNQTYANLKRIIDEGKTIVADGHDAAWKVRTTPSLALNDFYPQGQDQLVSQMRNEGGFVSIVNDLNPEGVDRNKFTVDALITQVNRVEDGDGDYAQIRCAVFNFRNDILPITLIMRNEDGIRYFEELGVSQSEPIYTKVWGKIVNRTQLIQNETESAFGEAAVDTRQRRIREWVITGAQREPYSFGDGGVLTPEDIKKAMENREVMLADTKKRSDDYYKNRNTQPSAFGETGSTGTVPKGDFQF